MLLSKDSTGESLVLKTGGLNKVLYLRISGAKAQQGFPRFRPQLLLKRAYRWVSTVMWEEKRINLATRTGVTNQLQLVSLRITKKEGPRSHCRKLDLARAEAEGFKSLFVSLVTFWQDLES